MALAPFVGRVIAVDESAAMLKSARHRTRDLPNVEVRSGTLEEPLVAAGELDAALLVSAAPCHRPAHGPDRVRRTLKPGGKLLIVDMQPHEHVEYREQMGHQWLGFEESALGAWLEEAGFGRTRFVSLPPIRRRGDRRFSRRPTAPC